MHIMPRVQRKRKQTITQLRSRLQQNPEVVAKDFPEQRLLISVPSMSIPEAVLGDINGIELYEERMLYVMSYLQQEKTEVIFVSSQPINIAVLAYYAEQFATQRVTAQSIVRRFHPIAVGIDERYLTTRLLRQKNAIDRIRKVVKKFENSVLMCFAVSYAEEQLARALGVPLYGARASLRCGTKSFSRKVFEEANVPFAHGYSGLRTRQEVYHAIARLWVEYPHMNQIVIKADVGVSGASNARILLTNIQPHNGTLKNVTSCERYVRKALENKKLWPLIVKDLPDPNLDKFFHVFESCGGGVVEQWIDDVVASPSVQFDVLPDGLIDINSTYDQVLSGVMYKGGKSPAHQLYARELISLASKIGPHVYKYGCLSKVSVDTVAKKSRDGCTLYAVEINVRCGGTSHPTAMAYGTCGAQINRSDGSVRTPDGRRLFIESHDNLQDDAWIGCEPYAIIQAIKKHNLAFNGERGIIGHLFSTLKTYGKTGGTFMARSPEDATKLCQDYVQMLHSLV